MAGKTKRRSGKFKSDSKAKAEIKRKIYNEK